MAMKSYDLSKLSVLVIEQSIMMRRLLADLLRQFGVRDVTTVDNEPEAWRVFNERDFDLLLVDWTPEFHGPRFVRRARVADESRNPFVPVIMVTAFADRDRVFEARDHGMNEYLRKPVSADILYRRIGSLIENDRIFIKAADYVGPNRRRRELDWRGAERRAFEEVDLMAFDDRRQKALPINFPERRRGYPGFAAEHRREGRR